MDPFTTENYLEYFGKRLLAMVVDALIVAVPCLIANAIIPWLGGVIIVFLYFPILESSELQATAGKYLVGLQVTGEQGERISQRVAFLRCLIRLISSALLFLGHIVALFTVRRQALHDVVAGTVVVYGRKEQSVIDAWKAGIRELFVSVFGATNK